MIPTTTPVLRGDIVNVELAPDTVNGWERKVIKCRVVTGDQTHEASRFPADTFVVQAGEAVPERGIRQHQELQGIKREQLTPYQE